MVVFSSSSRVFVIERERQTLDSLLTCPLTSREILQQKLAGVHTVMFWLLGVCALIGLIRTFYVPFNRSPLLFSPTVISGQYNSSYGSDGFVVLWEEWFGKTVLYMVAFLGSTFIYMQIIKWVAVWFSLKARAQMKAMLGSLLTILFICFGPVTLCVFCLVAAGSDPDHFLLFFYSSPIFVAAGIQLDSLYEFCRSTWLPGSDLLVILLNFLIYGGLALCVRRFVLTQLDALLERRDGS